MLGSLLKRGGFTTLVASLCLLAASVAQADVVSVTVANSHGDPFAYGGSDGTHTVTVTLADPAEAGGHDVDLASTSSDMFITSGTVTVPEGFTTASFDVAVTPLVVASDETATVTATDAGGTMTSNDFTILPMEARIQEGSPTSTLEQGTTYTFDVKMSARVASSQTVSVSSSNPDVTVTDAIIPDGNSHGTFTVTVGDNATGDVTLTVLFNGISSTRTLTLKKVALQTITTAGSVAAGTDVSVTITLNRVAVGDRTIALAYDGPAGSSAPTSVVVLNGTSSITFNVPTKSTLANGSRVLAISATLSGVTKTTKVQITP